MLRAEGETPLTIFLNSLEPSARRLCPRAAAGTAMVAGPPVAGDSEEASLLRPTAAQTARRSLPSPSICPATTLARKSVLSTKQIKATHPPFSQRESQRIRKKWTIVRSGELGKNMRQILTAWQRLNKSDTELHAPRLLGACSLHPRGLITCLKKIHILP